MSGARTIPRVAIVVPALPSRGGLAAVALFLYRTLQASGKYEPHLISLATSSTDEHSLRLIAPHTWRGRPRMSVERLGDIPYVHVGTAAAEIEPVRYRPRRELTKLLDTFDLVQLVAGTPALAHIARDSRRPVLLQCATMVDVERRSLLKQRGPTTVWRWLMTRIVSWMDETGAHHARLVQVENAWMRDRIAGLIGPERVRFCPPGVDTSLFHPGSANGKANVVLAVGRLDDPRKNLGMLVRAFAMARGRLRNDIRLVLAGERPPDNAVLTLAAKLGVRDAVDIRLALATDDLAALYRTASVFALSSDEEGLGIVALEAMASGIPVVCTRCGGPETSVREGETGYLVPLNDAPAMADALTTLLSDDGLRRRMSAEARAHVVENFSLQTTGDCFLKTYAEVLP